MRQSHLILFNTVIIWASRGLSVIPPLILVPYLIGAIGETSYGVYVLVWSLMMSISQLESSLQSGVTKYSAGFLAHGRMDEVNKVISSSFVYSLFLAILVCAATLVIAVFYKDPNGQIRSALGIVSIMSLFIVPLTPYIAVIRSRQCYYVGAITDTVSAYISLLAVVVWFYWVGPSLKALIIIMAGMLFLARFAQVFVAYRLLPGLQNRFHLFEKAHFRLISAFGAATVLSSLCLAANSTGVRWLMDALASTSFVAHLAIMLMPAALLFQIIGDMTFTIMPVASAYEATGNQKMLQELLVRSMRYSTILVLAGVIIASLLMRNVLEVWVGPKYAFLAPYALILFASSSFVLSTSSAHHMLKGMGKLRIVVLIYLIGLAIVPIGLILIVFSIWHNPYIAVIAGLSAGHFVCGCLQIGFGAKAVGFALHEMLMRAYVQPLMVAVAVSAVTFAIVAFSGIDGLVGRAGVSALALFLLFGACYVFIATTAERQNVKELIQLALKKISSIRGLSS